MKAIFTILFISFLQITFAQISTDISIMHEGELREAIISVPTKTPPAGGWPVVMMLHGTSGDKDVFHNAHGWRELGQQENFITIFPSALKWCFFDEDGILKNNTRFVCGNLVENICPQEIPNLIDDISFFRRLLKIVTDSVAINKEKIFVSGFSNGSCMTHKCSMSGTEIFSAAAGSSGPLHELDSLTPSKRIPMWYVLGTKDDRYFNERFPTELPFGGDSILAFHNKAIRRALVCNGLTDNFVKTEFSISKTYTFKECLPGQECAPYIFTINKGQTHQYPNGVNYPFDGPNLFWKFFNNPPATTVSTSSDDHLSKISLTPFPNPATDFVNLSSEEIEYQMTDVNGKLIKKGNDTFIDLSDVNPGFYFIKSEDMVYKVVVQK